MLARCSLTALGLVLALTQPARSDEADEKLLQAELLEVSAGDLTRAIEAYKALEADEKAPARVRARAALNIGRSLRKLGQLEAAKKQLEGVITAHSGEAEVVRQAQSFLRELQTGKADSQKFDWLKELEKNPEIQAKVFDLCLELASGSEEREKTARRQLRALGTVGVPVMERVLEGSRDSGQRDLLALTLLECGRFEHLAVLFDPERPPSLSGDKLREWLNLLPRRPEAYRKAVIAACERLTDPRIAGHAAFVRIMAGDRREAQALFLAAEPLAAKVLGWQRNQLCQLSAQDPGVADLLAERILDETRDLAVRLSYAEALSQAMPAKLTADHWVAMVKGDINAWLPRAIEEGKTDILERVTASAGEQALVKYFTTHFRTDQEVRTMPPAWAKALRSARALQALWWVASRRDDAIPDLVDLLRRRAAEAPGFTWVEAFNHLPSAVNFAFVGAMTALLDAEDPETIAIATVPLQLTEQTLEAKTLERLEGLYRAAQSSDDLRAQLFDVLSKQYNLDASRLSAWDWPKLLAEGDPLVEKLLTYISGIAVPAQPPRRGRPSRTGPQGVSGWLKGLSAEERWKLVEAGIASPSAGIRAEMIRLVPKQSPELVPTFRKLLNDPSGIVQTTLIEYLSAVQRADIGPLYLEMVQSPARSYCLAALFRLPDFASADCLEPIARLLDDPDIEVRTKALEALKKTRAALEERKEWDDLIRHLKAAPRVDSKSEAKPDSKQP